MPEVQPATQEASDQELAETNRRMWCAWFDGCTLNNPGPAGIGAVLMSPHGERFEISDPIGDATNNEAEYKAFIAVMTRALDEGCRALVVHGDSQLVLNQTFADWSVSSPRLVPLHAQARHLVAQFEDIRGQWIRRDYNTAADALSKKAAEAGARARGPEVAAARKTLDVAAALKKIARLS